MTVRPLPSAEVVLSSAYQRYYGPLRLPAQSATPSGATLIRCGGLLRSPGPALPWCPTTLSAHAAPATPEGPGGPGSCGGPPGTGLPPTSTGSAPSVSYRGYTWVRCAVRPARLRAPPGRSSGNLVLWVTPHTSLKLPGRAARSRGRTFTGEFQSIHGILSGTVRSGHGIRWHREASPSVAASRVNRPAQGAAARRATRGLPGGRARRSCRAAN